MCDPLTDSFVHRRVSHAGAVVWKQGEKSDAFKHVFSQPVCVGAKTQRGVGGSSSLEHNPVSPSEKTMKDGWQLRSRTTKMGRVHEHEKSRKSMSL